MPDILVTVPKSFQHPNAPTARGLAAWISEGDAAGDPSDNQTLWWFTTFGPRPDIKTGERVYVVCQGRVRGYAPLYRMKYGGGALGRCAFGRLGNAVAVTIPEPVTGFRGWRYRFWDRSIEVPFPDWRQAGPSKPAGKQVPVLFQ